MNHAILIQKLERKGIRCVDLNLIRSYLSGRSECVKIGNVVGNRLHIHHWCSSRKHTRTALITMIYVNFLCEVDHFFMPTTAIIYASHFCKHGIRTDINSIAKFCRINNLGLNVAKYFLMHFHPKRRTIPIVNVIINISSGLQIQTVSIPFLLILKTQCHYLFLMLALKYGFTRFNKIPNLYDMLFKYFVMHV